MGVELDEVRLALAATRLDAIGRRHHWWPQESPPWSELDPIGREEFLDIVGLVIEAYGSDAAAEARGIAAGRVQMREEATCIAEWSHMVLPDGGSPTVEEREVAEEAARRIRAVPIKQNVNLGEESKVAHLAAALPHDPIKGDEGREDEAAARVDDLAMLVRQLVHLARIHDPDSTLARKAADYLTRKGLQGSPLRAAPLPTADAATKERDGLPVDAGERREV